MTQPAPYSAFQVGGIVEPLSTGSSSSLLHDADPAVFYALDFYAYLISTYVGPRLMQAVTAAGMITGQRSDPIRYAVAQKYPWAPDLEFASNQFNFPVLALYRKRSTYKKKTASWEHDRCTFDVFYALPPLTAGQSEQVLPIFRSIAALLREKTTYGFDPGYTPPGGTLGQQPWSQGLAGVEEIGLESDSYGTIPGTGNLKFPFLLVEGYFVERDMYTPGVPFAGGDITGNLVAPDGTTVPSFLQASSFPAPTVTGVSPSGGTIDGGTSVTLTGTGFTLGAVPPMVLFGIFPATSVVQTSATTITCVTPAVSGAGAIGVTVVNVDGQSGSLASAFTYS